MSDETVSAEERRAAHRRGHSLPLYTRGRQDSQVADTLSPRDTETKFPIVGPLNDGEVLGIVDGEIVSVPGGGGGGTITGVVAGDGLSGGGSSGSVELDVEFGTSAGTVAEGDHTHSAAAVVSGTLDVDRVTAAAAGQSLRVNVADNAIEGFWPEADALRSIRSSAVVLSTTPANVFTISLPAAGTYAIDACFTVQSGTLGANRVVTFYFAHPGQTVCQIGWAQGASVSTSNGYGYGADFVTALPAVAFASTQDNVYSSVRCWGDFTVNAAGNLTVVAAIDGDTASCLAGSAIRIRRIS